MASKKPDNGHLTSHFKRAFFSGLTALTLLGAAVPAYAQQGGSDQPRQGSSVVVDDAPWHQNLNYIREMEAEERSYQLDLRALAEDSRSAALRAQGDAWRQAGRDNPGKDRHAVGRRVLGTIFNTRSGADNSRAAAHADRAQAYLETRHASRIVSIENRYQRDYERQHPQVRVATLSTTLSGDAQKRAVCERLELSELSRNRSLPPGSACDVILRGPPKP